MGDIKFIKLGDVIFSTDMISYIHIKGAGCDVHLKDDTKVSIATVPEKDMESAIDVLSGISG